MQEEILYVVVLNVVKLIEKIINVNMIENIIWIIVMRGLNIIKNGVRIILGTIRSGVKLIVNAGANMLGNGVKLILNIKKNMMKTIVMRLLKNHIFVR